MIVNTHILLNVWIVWADMNVSICMEMSDSRRRTFVCMIECMRYEYKIVTNEIVEVQKWLFEVKLGTMRLACIK